MTHVFDIDGTVVDFHLNTWLKGARETIIALHARGDKIVFMTARGPHDRGTEWSPDMTRLTILADLDAAGVLYSVLFDCPSPRAIHDDSPVYVDQRVTNQPYA